jgi:hypothetical protein
VFATSLAVTLSYAGETLHFDGELLSLSLKVILHLQALLLSILPTSGEKAIQKNRTQNEFKRDRSLLHDPRICKEVIGKSTFSPSRPFPMTKLFLKDQPRTISRNINFTG